MAGWRQAVALAMTWGAQNKLGENPGIGRWATEGQPWTAQHLSSRMCSIHVCQDEGFN